jgi:cytochrome P450
MASESRRIPDGPLEKYATDEDLLGWLGAQIARYGDIFKAHIYGTNAYVLNGPAYVEHVLLKNWQNYPKGQAIKRIALLLGNGLMVSKGDFWVRQRRMMQPAFNRAALGGLVEVIKRANAALVEKWTRAAQAGSAVNVTRDLSLLTLDIVLLSIFGDDHEAVSPRFRVVSDEAARNLEFAVIFTSLAQSIIDIAEERRRSSRTAEHDFLGWLMQARDRESGEGMTDSQLAKEIMTLIVAGHETTASTLNWTWYLLSQYPEVESKLSAELGIARDIVAIGDLKRYPYARNVIEEALRLYPAGWLMTRRALRDDRIGDYFVPAGTEIYISPYFIQRHPGLWEEPDAFNPDRFDAQDLPVGGAMLPFSAGPRNCIGEHLARMEMQIHLVMTARDLKLRYAGRKAPALAAGVNLLSAQDFHMHPELIQRAVRAADRI